MKCCAGAFLCASRGACVLLKESSRLRGSLLMKLVKAFHFAYRYLVGDPADYLIIVYTLLILTALDPAPYGNVLSNLKFSCKSGIPAPAYTWYVIALSISSVYRKKNIRNLTT